MYGNSTRETVDGAGSYRLNEWLSRRQSIAAQVRSLMDEIRCTQMHRTRQAAKAHELRLLEEAYKALTVPAYSEPPKYLPLEDVMGFTK